jgi:hypothetical protein
VDVMSPVPAAAVTAGVLAPRPRDLRGARVGILDNSKPNADVLIGRMAELLAAHAGVRPAGAWRKPGSARPAANLDEIVAACDAVLTGSAD